MLFLSNSQDPNDTSRYKIKPLWFSPERFFLRVTFLSEQKNLLKDLLFFLLTSQEEAA